MKADPSRIVGYLNEIKKNSLALNELVDQNELRPDSVPLKAAKYILIELAEAMSNTLQHIMAKEMGITVAGYLDCIVKAQEQGIISEQLFERLKPFFIFRNSLIHRYWIVDDHRLINNIISGHKDFDIFSEQVEDYINKKR